MKATFIGNSHIQDMYGQKYGNLVRQKYGNLVQSSRQEIFIPLRRD